MSKVLLVRMSCRLCLSKMGGKGVGTHARATQYPVPRKNSFGHCMAAVREVQRGPQ